MGRQDRAEETRRRILAAASDVFLEAGFSRANLNDILAKAGVTKGALYFHFDSKEAVAEAVVEESIRLHELACNGSVVPSIPALEKLIQLSFVSAALLRTDKMVQCGRTLAAEIGTQLGDSVRAMAPLPTLVAGLTVQARAEGDLREEVPADEAAAILCAMQYGVEALASSMTGYRDLNAQLAQFWRVLLPGFVQEESLAYFLQFLARTAGRDSLTA